MLVKVEKLQREIERRARLGRVVALLRTARGFTSGELAARCGVSGAYFSLAERGLRDFSSESLDAVAKVLDVQRDVIEGLASGAVSATRLGRWFKAALKAS